MNNLPYICTCGFNTMNTARARQHAEQCAGAVGEPEDAKPKCEHSQTVGDCLVIGCKHQDPWADPEDLKEEQPRQGDWA